MGIDELARPRLPWPVRAANAALGPVAGRLLSLDPSALVEQAQRACRWTDFGGEEFLEPLAILTGALEREAFLTPLGRLVARQQITSLLVTRLRMVALVKQHPEILAAPLAPPIVIVGMPRTGTTVLHRLLAQDPGLRSLPYWEALEPLPRAGRAQGAGGEDPRVRSARRSLSFLHYVAPAMITMHEMVADAPDEEIWLLALDFATMLFEASYRVPSFRDWYDAADLSRGYGWLRNALKVLQWYRGAERWLLKSPQHLGQLRPLLAAFPGAVVVQTHRDPVKVVGSFANMASYGRRMVSSRIDPREIASYWVERIEVLLARSAADRSALTISPIIDVHFAEVARDPLSVVRRIYAAAGRELRPAAEAGMRRFVAENQRARHGAHDYRLADFGIDSEALRERFHAYREYFMVADEEPP